MAIDVSHPIGLFILAAFGVGGSVGVLGAALALGIRHGIDWDHIAAITDITSTAAGTDDTEQSWLIREPGLMFTDESHHMQPHGEAVATAVAVPAAQSPPQPHSHSFPQELAHRHNGRAPGYPSSVSTLVRRQRPALLLGSMYAAGHGSVVVALGLLAILASQFLPEAIDPILERVVGVTLIVLAAYLLFSIVQFFRGRGEFRIRSRWMLIFAGARNGFDFLRSRVFGRPREHVHEAQQYGARTAYAVGMIHGVGAETGTQVLVIATAVGAGSRLMSVGALLAFVIGLLISNSIVTVISTAGFVSSRRRQGIYVAAGVVAAVFSLVIGILFLFEAGGELPDLGRYFDWIGGPS